MATAQQKRKNINVTSPEGIFKFPKLNEPDTKFNAAGVYTVKIILSEEEAAPIVEKLLAVAEDMYQETKANLEATIASEKGEKKAKAMNELKKLKKADLPMKDAVDEEGEPNGNVELNFSMKASRVDKKSGKTIHQRPNLFDAAGKKLDVAPSIWGGTTGCVAGQVVPFYTSLIGAGASLRLSAVQIINLVNGTGGTAETYGFGAKDGYAAEPGGSAEVEDETFPSDDDDGVAADDF